MPAGVLGFRAQRPHSSIQQDELSRERTNVAVVGFEGVLGRIQHQSENQRRHHDKEVGHEPDHTACIVLQVLGGQPRLAEEPKKGCAHHGQEGEYGHDKFGHFFPPSMSLKFATVLPVSIGTTAANASNRPRRLGFIDETCTSPHGGPSSPQPSKPQRDPALLVALLARPQSNSAGLQQIEGAPAQGCAHTSLLVFVLVIPPRPLPSWCACRPKENKQTGATALKEARSHAEQMSDETSRQTMLQIAVVAMPFRSSRETRTGRARRGLARSRGRRGRRCSACLFSSTCR